MEFSHCCNAYFHGSAAALQGKVQGLWVSSVNRASTGFLGGSDRQLRLPPCRTLARRLRNPRRPLLPLPKNSEGLSGEQKLALAGKRTAAGCRPLRTRATSSADLGRRKAYRPLSAEGIIGSVHRLRTAAVDFPRSGASGILFAAGGIPWSFPPPFSCSVFWS